METVVIINQGLSRPVSLCTLLHVIELPIYSILNKYRPRLLKMHEQIQLLYHNAISMLYL